MVGTLLATPSARDYAAEAKLAFGYERHAKLVKITYFSQQCGLGNDCTALANDCTYFAVVSKEPLFSILITICKVWEPKIK